MMSVGDEDEEARRLEWFAVNRVAILYAVAIIATYPLTWNYLKSRHNVGIGVRLALPTLVGLATVSERGMNMKHGLTKLIVSSIVFQYGFRLFEICILGIYDEEESFVDRFLHIFEPIADISTRSKVPLEKRKPLLKTFCLEALFLGLLTQFCTYMLVLFVTKRRLDSLMDIALASLMGYGLRAMVLTLFGTVTQIVFLLLKGILAPPVMKHPYFSLSVSEFYSQRWNRSVHCLIKRWVYIPLKVKMGIESDVATLGLFMGYAIYYGAPLYFSGASAGDLLSLCAYFLVQFLAVFLENHYPIYAHHPVLQRIWAFAAIILPCPLISYPYLKLLLV